MTVASTAVQTTGATGSGSTGPFSFSFRVQAYGANTVASQLEVKRVTIATGAETTLTYPTDYSVSVNNDQDSSPGGSITLTAALSSSYKLYIRRAPVYTQETDLTPQGPFNAQTVETQFDQVAMQVLELRAKQMRSPHVGIQASSSFNGEITGTITPGYIPQVNDAGTGFELVANNGSSNLVTATGSTTARTLADWMADVQNVKAHGALGNNSADDTAAIEAALAAGDDIYLPEGAYLTTGIVLTEGNKRIRGAGMGKTIIKLAASADDIVIKADTLDDIIIEDLTIDGNKANQTATVEATGIKLIKSNRARLSRLWIKDCEGHGIHLNNQGATVVGQTLDHIYARDCGSGPANTYGSNIAITNGQGVILTAVDSRDSEKAGFRVSGAGFVFNGCIAKGNGNGGLVPVSSDFTDFTINGGEFSGNGPQENNDGIRLVGVTRGEITGVVCSGNYGAGLHLLNGCTNITVNGGTFRNNGQHADAPDADEARSGIAITNSGTACSNIVIDGAKLLDDQGSPTQDYGIQIANSSSSVIIDKCVFSGNQTGPIDYSTSANSVRIGNLNIGLALPYQDASSVAITGTTATTDLFSRTISANEFGRRGVLRGRVAATCAGAAGTKTFSLVFGSSTVQAAVTASGSTDDVVIQWEAYATSTTGLRIFVTAMVGAASYAADYSVPTPTMTSDWVMKATGKLSNAADTITGTLFALERVR